MECKYCNCDSHCDCGECACTCHKMETAPECNLTNYRYGVYGVGETRMSFNACVFSTADEAHRAGLELQMRWFGMEGFDVVETNEPVNYIFPQIAFRPMSLDR